MVSRPDDGTVNDAVQLALVARHYERIGDHAVTIAEQVHFVVTGERTRGAAGPEMTRPPASALRRRPAGERGAGKGGVPGPALSVRALPGHALPTEESHIPEQLSEGGSSSRSRLTMTVRARRFEPVARAWRASKRAMKSWPRPRVQTGRTAHRTARSAATGNAERRSASALSAIGGVVTTTPIPESGPDEARKAFHENLDELRVDVIRLAALTTEAIAGGTQALLDGDLNAAEHGHRGRRRDRRAHAHDRGPHVPAARAPAAARDRPPLPRDGDARRATSSSAAPTSWSTWRRRRAASIPHQLDPKLRGIIDRMGTQASNQTARRDRRVRRRRPVMGRRARRHGRRDGRAHQEPVPPHPRRATAATRAPCCWPCRWRWSAGTTSASPTTRSRSPSGSASW